MLSTRAVQRKQHLASLFKKKKLPLRFLRETPGKILKKLAAANPAVDWKKSENLKNRYDALCKNMTFSHDWFSFHIPVWDHLLSNYVNKTDISVLEVGSFEGRSTVFFLDYLPNAQVTAVDSFFLKAGWENLKGDIRSEDCEVVFDRNVAPYGSRLRKISDQSAVGLNKLWMEGQRFDIIYIDGSHEAEDCLSDSILAWRLLKPNGIMIWDDYLWEMQMYGKHTPAWGINSFVRTFARELDVIHARYQTAVRKRERPTEVPEEWIF